MKYTHRLYCLAVDTVYILRQRHIQNKESKSVGWKAKAICLRSLFSVDMQQSGQPVSPTQVPLSVSVST